MGGRFCSILNPHLDARIYILLRTSYNISTHFIYARKILRESLGEDPYMIGLVSEANGRNAYIC